MLSIQTVSAVLARRHSTNLSIAALCLVLSGCGGGDGASRDSDLASATSAAPVAVAPSVADPIAVPEPREVPLSTASATSVDGMRPSVTAFIAALTVTDPQRVALYQAARALQATLTVDLGRRADLQAVVNALLHARACMRVNLSDAEVAWNVLQTRTFDTLPRRLRQALFFVASRLFAQWPANVVCTSAPPSSSGGGLTPPPPPPSPPAPTPTPPSAMLLMREEIARLEQQGVLPTLDRGTDIRGPDVNDNGVRDDIEAYIAALPITDPQKRAAMQTARVQQRSLLMDLSDKAAVRALSDASMAATACIGDRFEPDPGPSYEISLKIEAITANTPERARRYMRYMAALSGTSTAYPEGNSCED
jgi:hypothetical protein